jgi:hypothetical protein
MNENGFSLKPSLDFSLWGAAKAPLAPIDSGLVLLGIFLACRFSLPDLERN